MFVYILILPVDKMLYKLVNNEVALWLPFFSKRVGPIMIDLKEQFCLRKTFI